MKIGDVKIGGEVKSIISIFQKKKKKKLKNK